MTTSTNKKGASKHLPYQDALLRAQKVHARTSSREIILILDSLHNRTMVPRLLSVQGLKPLRAWLKEGGEFADLAARVWTIGLRNDVGSIYSWAYIFKVLSSNSS